MITLHVLVTGGAGFVGLHIARSLLDAGHAVRLLDVLHPAAHAGPPDDVPADAELVVGDVRDPATVDGALRDVDAVCHQAAMVGLGTDLADLPDYVSHNEVGTAVLLAALARRGFEGPVVQASSMVVYGEGRYRCPTHGEVRPGPRTVADLDAGRFDPPCPRCGAALLDGRVPEDAPTDPRSVYAATKLGQEHLAAAFTRETGVPVTSLRYHNVYGPGMPRDTPYAGVASIFASALAAGRAPRVFEDGRQRRDFVHVRDVARANVLALTRPEPVGGAINVCSGRPVTIGEVAASLHRAACARDPATPAPVVSGEYRLGDVRHVVADPGRAEEILGFRAVEDLDAGLREFAAAPLRAPVSPR